MLVFFAMFGAIVPPHAVLPVRARLLAARDRRPLPAVGRADDDRVAAERAARAPLRHEADRRCRVWAASRSRSVLLSQLDASSSYWPDVCLRMMLMAARHGAHHGARDRVDHGLAAAAARPASARRSTTRPARSAARSASRSSAACWRRPTASQIAEFLRGKNVPTGLAHTIEHSPLGFALRAGNDIRGLDVVATNAFVDGMHSGLLVAAGAALLGSLIAFVFLARRAPRDSRTRSTRRHDEAA